MTRVQMGLVSGLLLALALAVAACGGGGGGGKGGGVASLGGAGSATSTTAANAGEDVDPAQAALAYGRCMRQHGIDMADPQIIPEGITQPPLTGVRRNDPRATAAEQACGQRGGVASERVGDAHVGVAGRCVPGRQLSSEDVAAATPRVSPPGARPGADLPAPGWGQRGSPPSRRLEDGALWSTP